MKIKQKMLKSILMVMSVAFFIYGAEFSDVPTALPTRLENTTLMPSGKTFWMAGYSVKITESASVYSLVYSPDAKYLYIGEGSEKESGLYKYDLMKDKVLWKTQPFKKNAGNGSFPDIRLLEISKNGKKISAHPPYSELGVSSEIRIINTTSGESENVIRIPSFHPKCSGVYDDKTLMLTFPASKFGLSDRYIYLFAKNERGSNMYGCLVNLDRWIIKYDLTTRKRVWSYNITQPGIPKYGVPENSCSNPIPSLDVTVDEKLVVFSDCTGTITSTPWRDMLHFFGGVFVERGSYSLVLQENKKRSPNERLQGIDRPATQKSLLFPGFGDSQEGRNSTSSYEVRKFQKNSSLGRCKQESFIRLVEGPDERGF